MGAEYGFAGSRDILLIMLYLPLNSLWTGAALTLAKT